jgi:hypothetical protein
MTGRGQTTQQSAKAAKRASAQPGSAWSVGPRQVIAAFLGVLLYGLLSHTYIIVLLSSDSPDIFLLAMLIPVLFGIFFGPWVGLIVGGFGFLVGDFVANAWLLDFNWNNGFLYMGGALNNFRDLLGWNGIPGYLVNAGIGMAAGFTTFFARRFNTLNELATASLWATIIVTAGIAIVVYSTVLIYQSPYYTFSEATVALVDTVLPNLLIILIVFPLLLLLGDRMFLRKQV